MANPELERMMHEVRRDGQRLSRRGRGGYEGFRGPSSGRRLRRVRGWSVNDVVNWVGGVGLVGAGLYVGNVYVGPVLRPVYEQVVRLMGQ